MAEVASLEAENARRELSFTHAYAKLPAQDVERARRFYAEKLGLTPFHEHEGHLRYEVAGVPFLLFRSSGAPSGTHDQFGLVVADIDAAVATLRSRGVTFETFPGPPGVSVSDGIMDLGAVRAAWFKDSEGNLLSITQFVAGAWSRD